MMNESNPPREPDRREDVADQNVARLVSAAYRPEVPRQEFVQRVAAAMIVEAQCRVTAAPIRRQPRLRPGLHWAVAATVLVAMGGLLWDLRNAGFWEQRAPSPVAVGGNRPSESDASPGADRASPLVRDWPIEHALTARPRAAAPPVPKLAIGESLRTGAAEQRRVELPDGSILYLNRDTAVTLKSPRRVVLERGEAYVEVAPRYNSPDPENGEHRGDVRFVVLTPNRELTALGTRFNVRTDRQTTAVAVVQGQVQVSGLDRPLDAGQQLAAAAGGSDDATAESIDQVTPIIDWTRDLRAAAESPLVPASAYSGGALVARRPDGRETSLSMRRYHLDVHIEDGFARTTIDQTYFNDETWRMEGTFYFPLPPDASLSRLAMYVDGRRMEGGMAERQHAREVFETIVRRQKDPALLEWIDGSTFRMRVFPLEGRQEKRIVLSYTQRLPRLGDRVQYRFPGGHKMPKVARWSCHVRAVRAADWRWQADAYAFQAARDGADLTLDAASENIAPDRNVVIDLVDRGADEASGRPAQPAMPDAQFASVDHEGQHYLGLRYRFRQEEAAPAPRRDWVFLFEASADRDPVLARAQVEIVRTLLEQAPRSDTFTLLTAGTRIRRFARQSLAATPENVQQAVRFLEQAHLVGALDLANSLRAAAEDLGKVRKPCLVHVGSGYASLGEKQPAELVRLIPAGTVYAGVGVGNRWNRPFMKQAAGQTGGYFTQINPDEPISWRTIELYSRLNSPRLVNVRVSDPQRRLTFLTAEEVVCQGEELFAVARCPGDVRWPEFVEISGQLAGQPFAQRLPVGNVSRGAGYLPRTWAKLEIDRMVAEDAVAHHDEIVKLSMAMYVMSPFTSLLVLENEQMYQEFHVDRGRQDHWALYPCPDKIDVVHEPLSGSPEPAKELPADAKPPKPAVAETLKTILVRLPPGPDWRSSSSDRSRRRSVSVWELWQPQYQWTDNWDTTTVRVPDGGTVLLGGIRRRPAWRDEPDVPSLYPWSLDRLDANQGIGREAQSLMMMVTPRIIIQEEEELPLADERYLMWRATPRGRIDPLNVPRRTTDDFDSLIELPLGDLVLPLRPLDFSPDGSFLESEARDGTIRLWDIEGTRFRSADFLSPMAFPDARTWADLAVRRKRYASIDLDNPDAAERKLLAALSSVTSLDLPAAPLEMAIAYLKDRYDIPIEIDQAGLARVGVRLDAQVTLNAKGVPLADALQQLLRPVQLTFVVQDHVVLIVPDDYADILAGMAQDPLMFAPGMHTTTADVQAVLEAESQIVDQAASGSIDRLAAELIEGARSRGWYRYAWPGGDHRRTVVTFDGQGRFRIETRTRLGLNEQIVCDGRQLWHLYPELGVGAQRPFSRFHRAVVERWIPWLLPPADQLARGADVRAIDARTVAVVPHEPDRTRLAAGLECERAELRLVFGRDGRLIERQIVALPSAKVLWRETFGAVGTVQQWDENGELLSVRQVAVEPCPPPSLVPDETLVLVPLPWRTREHALAVRGLKDDGVHDGWSREDALAVLAAETASGSPSLSSTVGWCFLAKHDARLGFGPLLLAAGGDWPPASAETPADADDDVPGLFRRWLESSDSLLARYVAAVARRRTSDPAASIGLPDATDCGFLQQLAALHDLCLAWRRDGSGERDTQRRSELQRQTVRFLRSDPSQPFAAVALSAVRRYGDAPTFVQVFDDAADAFQEPEPLAFALRFAHATLVAQAGDAARGRDLLRSLANDMLDAGYAPPLDRQAKTAFFSGTAGQDAWRQLVEHVTGHVLRGPIDPSALAIARQLHQADERDAAERIFAGVTASDSSRTQMLPTLAAVSYLRSTGQEVRAAARLDSLLAEERAADTPELWRLAAALAKHRGLPTRAAEYLDQALDLEYSQGSGSLDLARLRADYRDLLERYCDAGDDLAGSAAGARQSLVARVVRAADRWRSLDPDTGDACRLAADALSRLGAVDLAWDYLTSPLVAAQEASIPWDERGREYHDQGQYELAARAYALAFRADPGNAELLWNQARALLDAGQPGRAQTLLQELVHRPWETKYDGIRRQAEQALSPQ